MPAEFLTSKNNLKANYRFLSGWPKPGFRDSCHPEVVAACRGTRPLSFLLKGRPCVCRARAPALGESRSSCVVWPQGGHCVLGWR